MDGPPLDCPEFIGPYRVLQVLGRGGMGAVYEAEESGPVHRRVAIKVVQEARQSSEVLARFEAERQALALMNHPGIARVFQAGKTDGGEPYFTMELVRGLPLTEYCDQLRLPLSERIELFMAVCRAVQHAHQKSVVHRDLKPSNVLVMEQDGVRQPKIIDFGVAKALGQRLTDRTVVTLSGTAIGTAAYMSPEQADSTMDVDTRSDIYSLGVMLYELLVGVLPMEPSADGIHQFIARIASRQTDPPAPSARFRDSRDSGAIAFTRRTDPRRLHRALRGDLDWIVMMAMQPDRALRYPTVNGLAEDLRRHLRHEPVVARPPSTRDRVEKFVRRHQVGVASAALVSLALAGGAVLATAGFVRARRAERMAGQEAATSQQVTAFLTELFAANDPGRSRGDTVSARTLLTRGAARVASQLSGQPLLQARLMLTLGGVHEDLALYDEAQRLFGDALRVLERELGPRDLFVARALYGLGEVAYSRGQLAAADSALQRALAIRRALLPPTDTTLVSTLSLVANMRFAQGRYAESESLYKLVLAADSIVPASDLKRARYMRSMATVYWAQTKLDAAARLFRNVIEFQERTLGPGHYEVAGTLNNLGGTYYSMGRYQEALSAYQRALPVVERALGPNHPITFGLYNNIGETYWKLHRNAEAEALLRRSLAIKEKVLAPDDFRIATTLHALAGACRDQSRYAEAERYYKRALAIREKAAATNPGPTMETLRDYAILLTRSGREREAARMVARADGLKR